MKNGKNGYRPSADNLKPHNLEAEQAVLGSMLIDQDAIITLAPVLKPDDFYLERHAWLYEALKDLYEKRAPADLITVCDELERAGRLEEIGGAAWIASLIGGTPTSIHAEHYAGIVERDAVKRRLIDTGTKIVQMAYDGESDPDELIGQAESLLLSVGNDRTDDRTRFTKELASQLYDHIERVRMAGGITGLPTGLTDLDLLIGGLQKSDMVVLAGRPGMGKTSLAIQIAEYNATNHQKKSLIFSLEMSAEQLVQRLVSSKSGIEVQRLRNGDIKDSEWDKFFEGQVAVGSLPIAIDDTPALTPAQMRSVAIRHHARYGLDLIIIDYIQLMDSDRGGQNRHQEISVVSRACKKLARELNIPVIVLSQLNRGVESRGDKRPMLSDLRESGAIEADADVVMFLYRDEVYNPNTELAGTAEVIVAKHRSGPTGILSVFFKKKLTQFADLAVNVHPLEQVD